MGAFAICPLKKISSHCQILQKYCFERDVTQAEDVDREKKEIYEPYLNEHYNVALENWTVEGSRGTISKRTWLYLKSLCISQQVRQDIILDILKDSLHILHHHLYVN